MKNSLRILFTTNPYLYFIWFKVYRSNRGLTIKWFNNQSKIYFDGYPRSGNTFLAHLMRAIYDDKKIIHHFHAVAPLKIAFKKYIKSIIIIRDPKDSISSNYLKKHELKVLPEKPNLRLLQMMLNDYIVYYKFIYKNINKVHLVKFNDLISNPESTLLKIDNYLDNYSNISEEDKLKDCISKRKTIKFGAKSKLGSSLPSKQKEDLKSVIKKELKSLKGFTEAENIFSKITCLDGKSDLK